MRFRPVVVVVAVLIIIAAVLASWTSASYSATGKFSVLPDGSIVYTHTFTNETWHPMRYVIAADPQSPVKTVLIKSDSSEPERTVTRMEPGTDSSAWSVTLNVPGRQQASIEVTLQTVEPLTSPGLTATTSTTRVYPSFTAFISVNK